MYVVLRKVRFVTKPGFWFKVEMCIVYLQSYTTFTSITITAIVMTTALTPRCCSYLKDSVIVDWRHIIFITNLGKNFFLSSYVSLRRENKKKPFALNSSFTRKSVARISLVFFSPTHSLKSGFAGAERRQGHVELRPRLLRQWHLIPWCECWEGRRTFQAISHFTSHGAKGRRETLTQSTQTRWYSLVLPGSEAGQTKKRSDNCKAAIQIFSHFFCCADFRVNLESTRAAAGRTWEYPHSPFQEANEAERSLKLWSPALAFCSPSFVLF